MKTTEVSFLSRRGAVLASLGENKTNIKYLNEDIDKQIADNNYRISQLKL